MLISLVNFESYEKKKKDLEFDDRWSLKALERN